MASPYFTRRGFISVEFLPMGQKYNSQFYTETVLLLMVSHVCHASEDMTAF
jgi:hypothetical protein